MDRILNGLIELHRSQFATDEYLNNRIADPTTGTLDVLAQLGFQFPALSQVRRKQHRRFAGQRRGLL